MNALIAWLRRALVAVLALVGCATPNPFVIRQVTPRLYRFPQPQTADEWQAVRDALGPGGHVVKLNAADEGPAPYSDTYARELGLVVHELAIEPRDDGTLLDKVHGVIGEPDARTVAQADDVVCNPAWSVGVHCTHGWDRTGFEIARARVICEGWAPEKAKEEWFAIASYIPHGKRIPPPGLLRAWEDFVEQLAHGPASVRRAAR